MSTQSNVDLINNYAKNLVHKSRTYSNAEILLKTLKAKGKFTVETVLETFQHYIKKIDGLTLDNRLVKRKLEYYQSRDNALVDACIKAETSTDIKYLQSKVSELLKELILYRKIGDDRVKLKTEVDKLTSVIKQLAWPLGTAKSRYIGCEVEQIDSDRQRLKELLNKMLGIEEKIVEFKRQAAFAAHLQMEVKNLRRELQDERENSNQKIRKVIEKFRKQIDTVESQIRMCKKERDLYEKVAKKLENQAKNTMADREMYEKKSEDLEYKYEKVLFELEKVKTKNADLLYKDSHKQDGVVNELKLEIHNYREQLSCAQKLNVEYEKKLEKLSAIIVRNRSRNAQNQIDDRNKYIHEFSNIGDFVEKSVSLENMLCELDTKLKNPSRTLLAAHSEKTDLDIEKNSNLPFRYWRKISINQNIYLKIAPQIPPPVGFKRDFIIKNDADMAELRRILVPSDDELKEIVKRKTKSSALLGKSKRKANELIRKIQNIQNKNSNRNSNCKNFMNENEK